MFSRMSILGLAAVFLLAAAPADRQPPPEVVARAKQIVGQLGVAPPLLRFRMGALSDRGTPSPHLDPDEIAALLSQLRGLGEDELSRNLSILLAVTGTHKHLPALWRHGAPGDLERFETRLYVEQLASRPCAAPSPKEIAEMRGTLRGFLTIRSRDGRLVAEPPTEAELGDLAYFFVAIDGSGPPVGQYREGLGGWYDHDEQNVPLERASAAIEEAKRAGDPAGVAAAAEQYLKLLGYPGPLDLRREATYSWHHAGYERAMREWAAVAELSGDYRKSLELNRRMPAGAGPCGTGADALLQQQIRATIRAEELLRGCRATVAERLREPQDFFAPPQAYGRERLKAAGFDLVRLFRGAMLTAYRDLPAERLHAILHTASLLTSDPIERLNTRGPEAWDARIQAIEGFADVGGRDAAEPLLELALTSSETVQRRAIGTLGRLVRRLQYRCKVNGHSGSVSTVEPDSTQALVEACGDGITRSSAQAVATRLARLLEDEDGEIRAVTVRALGDMHAKNLRSRIAALARDPYVSPDTHRIGPKDRLLPVYPVREAVEAALENLDE